MAGWVEVLPLILCSHDENFAWMNRIDDGTTAVKLANPKTLEYQVVRTSLIPGLLKTIRENRAHPLPIRVFETADVVFKDASLERQARNLRRAAAVWCNKTAGFEVVHGLLDRIMQMLEVPRIASNDTKAETGYYIKEGNDATYFPGRSATIYYRAGKTSSPPVALISEPLENPVVAQTASSKGDEQATLASPKDKPQSTLETIKASVAAVLPSKSPRDVEIGKLGILHPTVLQNFEIPYPCSSLEFDLEPFKKEIAPVWE